MTSYIDTDVHCGPGHISDLYPYLSDYWQTYLAAGGVRLPGLEIAYPPNSPIMGAPVPQSPAALRTSGAPSAERYIVHCIANFHANRNPHFAAALASALNDWTRDEWLDADDRFRANIAVSRVDPEAGAAEIRRVGGDARFVGVVLPVRTDVPYGNVHYQPIYEAAVEHDLTISLHAWGLADSSRAPSGATSTYFEDYLGNQLVIRTHLSSLISEGVFDRFPELRVAVLECGFTWLPSYAWRLDKDWKTLFIEVPWVRERPSAYIRRHIRFSAAPAHLPHSAADARRFVDLVGSDLLMYASDFPHVHDRGAQQIVEVLDEDEADAFTHRTAATLYRL